MLNLKQYQELLAESEKSGEFTLYNPYTGTNPDDLCRLSADISIEHRKFLRSVHPDRGIVMDAINMFMYAIVTECKQLGITSYTPENERTIRELIRRRTAITVAKSTNGRNVTGRAKAPRKKASRSVSKSASSKKGNGNGQSKK